MIFKFYFSVLLQYLRNVSVPITALYCYLHSLLMISDKAESSAGRQGVDRKKSTCLQNALLLLKGLMNLEGGLKQCLQMALICRRQMFCAAGLLS